MQINSMGFRLFSILLLFFFWRNIEFWMSSIVYKAEFYDKLRVLSLVGVWGLVFLSILTKYRLVKHGFVNAFTVVWGFVITIVLLINKSTPFVIMLCLLWPILFEYIYEFAILDRNAESKIRRLFVGILGIGVLYFGQSLIAFGFESASNMVYFLILAIPMLIATTNSKYHLMLLLLTTGAALVSLKRSMMLAMVLFWFVYFGVYCIRKYGILRSLLLASIIAIAGVYSFEYVDSLSGNNITARMESDDVTNGRDNIYDYTLLMIYNMDTQQKIFGSGHGAVKRDSILDISAHNEWLEIIYDYGYIVLFLYVILWFYMIWKWYMLWRKDSKYFIPYTLCICIWGVMSMVSQLLVYNSYVYYLFMFIAFIEGVEPSINKKSR